MLPRFNELMETLWCVCTEQSIPSSDCYFVIKKVDNQKIVNEIRTEIEKRKAMRRLFILPILQQQLMRLPDSYET